MHITGAQRPDCPWRRRTGRRSRRPRPAICPLLARDLDLLRSQSPGNRGADDGAGAARLFGGGGDPADAHPGPRGQKRGAAARRHPGPANRGRPVPRAAVRRTADPDLLGGGRQSPANQRRHLAADAAGFPATSPQRILAFGTWLPPEPALQMDHAVDALREAGEGFLLNLTTSNGHAFEAMGRAIGGQAIVRIRELSGLRRELAETNLRHKALLEETEMLRGFAAAAPWPIWTKRAKGGLSYANAAYARATEAASVADAIDRDLELLDSADRSDMDRALNDTAAFTARLPIVVGGERRIYDVHALQCRRRQRRHRHRRQRSHRARRGAGADGGGASPHPRSIVVRRRGVRRPAAAGVLQRFLSPAVGPGPRLSRQQSRRFERARPAARRAQTARAAGFPGLEGQAARGLSRGRARKGHLVSARRPRASASSPRPIRKAASPICSTTSPKAWIWRGDSTA